MCVIVLLFYFNFFFSIVSYKFSVIIQETLDFNLGFSPKLNLHLSLLVAFGFLTRLFSS